MASKKPKPATAGERLQMKMQNVTLHELRTLDQLYEYRNAAAMEDRAIARAVRKERERCGFVAFAAKCNCESFDWAHDWILHPENQKP